MKIIKNVTVAKINSSGTFLEWKETHPTTGNSIWLTGWNRPRNVFVGMVGTLEYKTTPSNGLWWFVQGKTKEEQEEA